MEVIGDLWGSQERWIKHYSSGHNILLVGDGDFSFSLCLAWAFGSATNIVATSLDTYDELISKYTYAMANLEVLRALGATVLHGVDATKMKNIPYLQWKKFHRIIYNFPHAGFLGKEDNPNLIQKHRKLVHGFFSNASCLLFPDGEIHVSHKIKAPFDRWGIEDLASECSLFPIGQDIFRIRDYPGYFNKRGSGPRPDEPFPLGECRTFKFKLYPVAEKNAKLEFNNSSLMQIPVGMQQQPSLSAPSPYNGTLFHNAQTCNKNECHKIFGGYLKHAEDTFGSALYDVGNSVRKALKDGFEMYMAAAPQRESSGYIGVLEELHLRSNKRSESLRQMLLLLDQHATLTESAS